LPFFLPRSIRSLSLSSAVLAPSPPSPAAFSPSAVSSAGLSAFFAAGFLAAGFLAAGFAAAGWAGLSASASAAAGLGAAGFFAAGFGASAVSAGFPPRSPPWEPQAFWRRVSLPPASSRPRSFRPLRSWSLFRFRSYQSPHPFVSKYLFLCAIRSFLPSRSIFCIFIFSM
jgi:hypothetical protein